MFDQILTIASRLANEDEKKRDHFWTLYGNDSDFLGRDLEASEWSEILRIEEIETLKNLQCAKIRELRSQAYVEEFDGLAAGVAWDGDDDAEAREKREEIKNRYPYPGKYRYKAEGVE